MDYPSFARERELSQSHKCIAGVDEAGRGPLAGPVVAGAVIFDLETPSLVLPLVTGGEKKMLWYHSVRDSKTVSEKERPILAEAIKTHALAWGIGIVAPEQIDAINIHCATLEAMRLAVEQCAMAVDYLLIDGLFTVPGISCGQEAVVRGDGSVLSIAAASIIAKVARDEIMLNFHEQYPQYEFSRHKGYGTKLHYSLIEKFGLCPIHRRSFIKHQTSNSKHQKNTKQTNIKKKNLSAFGV